MEISENHKKNLYRAFLALLIILSLYFAIKSLSEFRSYGMMGSSQANTITLSGHGEIQAVPDIANIYFNIQKDGKTVKEAQDAVAPVEKASLDFLKNNNVDEKDIKTANASFNPKYEYRQAVCPQAPPSINAGGAASAPSSAYYCPGGKQVIIGYTASESITIKVRKTDDVGKIMQGLGGLGVTDLSGPNFSIDNEDDLKAEARKKAIDDAREKARVLAKDLGVTLGRIANFSESGGGYYPMAYAKDSVMSAGATAPAPAEIPKGENTISSDVTITYEIK